MRRVSKLLQLSLLPLAAVLAVSTGASAQTPNYTAPNYTAPNYTPTPVPTAVLPQVTAVGNENAPRLNDRPLPSVQSPDGARSSMAPLRLLDPPEPIARPVQQRPVIQPPASAAPVTAAPVTAAPAIQPSAQISPPAVTVKPPSEPATVALPLPAPPVSKVEVTPLPAPSPAPAPTPVAAPPVPAPPPAATPTPVVVSSPPPAPPPAVVKANPPPAPVVKTVPPARSAPTVTARPADIRPVGTVRVNSDAYIRAQPDRNGRVVTTVSAGTTLQVLSGGNEDWINVAQNGKRLGFVSSTLIAQAEGGKAGGKSTSASRPVPVSVGSTTAALGKYEKALPKDRGCALPKSVAAKPRKSFSKGMTVRALAATNLRVAPACDAKVRDVLETGERVTVMAVHDGWYQVGRRGQALGYVGGALLATAGN